MMTWMRKPTTQLGAAVRRHRKEGRGWTQGQLAKAVSRTLQWVSQIETGSRLTTDEGAIELAEALNLPKNELVRYLASDRASRDDLPTGPHQVLLAVQGWAEAAREEPDTHFWALSISGHGFLTSSDGHTAVTQAVASCAAAGVDIVYCPLAAPIGAKTDTRNYAPWTSADNLQGALDEVLDASELQEARDHLWLLVERNVPDPISMAIFAQFARLLLFFKAPREVHDLPPENAGPGDFTRWFLPEGIEACDAWVHLKDNRQAGNALWVQVDIDDLRSAKSYRHWFQSMCTNGVLALSRLFDWERQPAAISTVRSR